MNMDLHRRHIYVNYHFEIGSYKYFPALAFSKSGIINLRIPELWRSKLQKFRNII
jgi:hypothetical protein